MFHAIGRFLKKVAKKLKKWRKKRPTKIAKGVSKKGKSSKTIDYDMPEVTVETPPEQEARKSGSMAMKLVILTVIASGVYMSGFAATPVGVPITAALGGEIARTANQIWST